MPVEPKERLKPTTVEYRIVWQRVGLRRKSKRFARKATADRFILLLGPEPWLALGKDPDQLFCCSGDWCGCGGNTWREHLEGQRKEMPPLLYVRTEMRSVGPWS